jgi:polar amino acid transport system permease protein
MGYEWNFKIVFRNMDMLLEGLVNTLLVTGLSLIFGLMIGLTLAMLRLSQSRWLSIPSGILIEFLRSTPPLVQLFWVFFALPLIIGVAFEPLTACVITFSFQSAAFFAEVFRGGVISIDKGQWEGARAVGMRHWQMMRHIILPQAILRMIPAFAERSIEVLKTTTLVATVAYADLLYQGIALSQQVYRPLEVFTVVAVMYFCVIFPISQGINLLERRLGKGGEGTVH